jgi:hypothetical protein
MISTSSATGEEKMYFHFKKIGLLLAAASIACAGIASASTVKLSWQANREPDLEGYYVYYGTRSRSYGPPVPVGKNQTYSFPSLEAGKTYYFAVTAVDNSGNESGYSNEASLQLPAGSDEPATVTIQSPTTAGTYETHSKTVDLSGTVDSDGRLRKVVWQTSNGDKGYCEGRKSWSAAGIPLVEGANQIAVVAYDEAGNKTRDKIVVTRSVDRQAPGVEIAAPTTSSTFETQAAVIDLSGTAADNAILKKVVWRTSNGDKGYCEGLENWSVVGVPLVEGQNRIAIVAYDVYGNKGRDKLYVTRSVDRQAPEIEIADPTQSDTLETYGATIDLSGSATDNGQLKKVVWRTSNGDKGHCEGMEDWSVAGIPLVEGQNRIAIVAYDVYGNKGRDKLYVTRLRDDEKPTIAITDHTGVFYSAAVASTIDVTGTASDNDKVRKVKWRTSDGHTGTCEGTRNWLATGIPIGSDYCEIEIIAVDPSGNKARTTLKYVKNVRSYEVSGG